MSKENGKIRCDINKKNSFVYICNEMNSVNGPN